MHVASKLILVLGCLCSAAWLPGQIPSDYAVQVSAAVQTQPPLITLSWPFEPTATANNVYRKGQNDTSWGTAIATLPGSAKGYDDTNVEVGEAYEYRVDKVMSGFTGNGYIYAGIEAPEVEFQGKMILIVDNTFASNLNAELSLLEGDLVGDGWTVIRHDVARMAVDPADLNPSGWAARASELASVKALIKADYDANPGDVKAVLLFGHVPVPYSGDIWPDGHTGHQGAWACDGYYGDMDGFWTDSTVNRTSASDPRNQNVPGDGKFDQSIWPTNGLGVRNLELQVGRVDMANLSAFSQSEQALLQRYLNKDHQFRRNAIAVQKRALIDDNLGLLSGEAPAQSGWRNFAPFFGAANLVSGTWPVSQSYLWAYGCGAGTFTSAGGVTTTAGLAGSDPPVVFTMLFGSWFGDWDSQNNLLRACLATPTYTLTSAWVSRPPWYCHYMALGETIGSCALVVQNNPGALYSTGGMRYMVHIALMGDPTLRMNYPAPVSNVVAAANGVGGVNVSWSVSPEEGVLGYHVYRSAAEYGPYTRANTDLIAGTSYTDPGVDSNVWYMVRAVKLEVTGSGSYYNASTGIFAEYTPASGPVLTVTAQDATKVYGEALPEFTAGYSGFVNGDTTNDLTALATISTTATASSPVGPYPITPSGAASPNYSFVYVPGTLTIAKAGSSASVSASANPSPTEASVTFTATLTAVAPGAGTPTGTVQFTEDGTALGSPMSLTGGAGQYTTSLLSHGHHTIGAEYAGDASFNGTTNSISETINKSPVVHGASTQRYPASGVKIAEAALLGSATDDDGDGLSLAAVSGTSANGGSVVRSNGWVFYAPAPGFTNTDSFTYMISDGFATVQGTVTVDIRVDNGQSPNLAIVDLGNGSFRVWGDGIPGRTYNIQYTSNLETPEWQTIGTAMANTNGAFLFEDTNRGSAVYYRSVFP